MRPILPFTGGSLYISKEEGNGTCREIRHNKSPKKLYLYLHVKTETGFVKDKTNFDLKKIPAILYFFTKISILYFNTLRRIFG